MMNELFAAVVLLVAGAGFGYVVGEAGARLSHRRSLQRIKDERIGDHVRQFQERQRLEDQIAMRTSEAHHWMHRCVAAECAMVALVTNTAPPARVPGDEWKDGV